MPETRLILQLSLSFQHLSTFYQELHLGDKPGSLQNRDPGLSNPEKCLEQCCSHLSRSEGF